MATTYTPANYGSVLLKAATLLRKPRPDYTKDERVAEARDELETYLFARFDNPATELSDVAYDAMETAAKAHWVRY
jgi:hypothetical protein